LSSEPKMVTIGQLFSEQDFDLAVKIWDADRGAFHSRCVDEVVRPKLAKIEEVVGRPMNVDYLAYQLEYALARAGC
jgi:hypothetical protein